MASLIVVTSLPPGAMPLHLAALHGHLNLVKFLTEWLDACVMCKDNDCGIPVHYALKGNQMDVLQYLVENNTAVRDYMTEDGKFSLTRNLRFTVADGITQEAIWRKASYIIHQGPSFLFDISEILYIITFVHFPPFQELPYFILQPLMVLHLLWSIYSKLMLLWMW